MAESIVRVLATQISTWLQEEQKLLGGISDEARIIRDEMEHMRAFLRVADETEESDHQLKEWVRQVRQLAYNIEDVLEEYLLRFAHTPSPGIAGRVKKVYASIKLLKAKHKMASEIKALRYRAESASKTFASLYSVLPRASSGGVANNAYYDGRGDALLLEEADVVGIEKPRKQLLQWISATDYTVRVVSVVGMAGLGKTTLVKKVFDDPSLKSIDHHAWITVSQEYRVENLLRQLIKQFVEEVKQAPPHDLENMNADSLRKFVRDFLINRDYLIILDDIWSINAWEALFYAFPRSTSRGRGCIIITTRIYSIGCAACCGNGDHVYRLQPLPPKESEELFYRKTFGGEFSCPRHLKEISENILKSCNGLPLAIVVISGVLVTKRNDVGEWRKFGSSIRFELGNDLKRIERFISLSYYDLPYYLKPCFLHLSIFPEDQLLARHTIIRLWIAEGFIEEKQWKSTKEIAEGYLNELSNRSLIQVEEASWGGKLYMRFRIHDLVREYIISKAREQNMIIENGAKEIPVSSRWLTLDDDSRSRILEIDNFRCLRTLLFFGSTDSEWVSVLRKVFNGGCRMLKELDLRGFPLDEIPNEVFELYHLKYLSLRDTNVSIIPKCIGNLVKLETLNLENSMVTKLPIEVLKLQRLRYLGVYRCRTNRDLHTSFDLIQPVEAPFEIGQLLCLQDLYYVDASVRKESISIVKEIGKLTELRTLRINNLRKEDGKDLCSSLAKLSHITYLTIWSIKEDEEIDMQDCMPLASLQSSLRSLVLTGRLENVPQWLASLDALTELQLRFSRLGEDPLESLQALPNLQYLVVYDAYEGEGLVFKCGGFLKLKELQVCDLRGLKWVRVEKGSMPCVNVFLMFNCNAMMEQPSGIEHLTHLNRLEFQNMAMDFLKKLSSEKKRDGNQWKLGHIPKLIIGDWVDGEWKQKWL